MSYGGDTYFLNSLHSNNLQVSSITDFPHRERGRIRYLKYGLRRVETRRRWRVNSVNRGAIVHVIVIYITSHY
jgi:hypothetical protein